MKYLFLLLLSNAVLAQPWDFVEDMTPVNAIEGDFGAGMVFAGDYLVVGWPRTFSGGLTAGNTPPDACGEVITYEKVGDTYQEIARLTATDLTGSCVEGDGFGYGLAYNNGRLAIGMPAGVRAGMGRPGGGTDADSRVFMTHFENGNWVLDETLEADDLGGGRGMGFQLVLEDDVLLVHAHEYDTLYGFSFVVSTGVYVFEDSGNGFSQTQKLTENFHLFGQDFDIENNQIVVGAWGEQALTQPGRIYVYDKQDGNWSLTQTINDTRNTNLGNQIAIDDNLMAVGAVQAGGYGAAVIYEKSGGQWQEKQFIQPDDSAFNDQFGISLQLNNGELLVGATGGTNTGMNGGYNVGAVYYFEQANGGLFTQVQKLETLDPDNGDDQFGGNIIFNDTDLLVNDTSGSTIDNGITELAHYSRENNGGPINSFDVSAKTTGLWTVDGVDNQAVNIEILNDDRVVMYAQVNHNGEDLWLFGYGEFNDNIIDIGVGRTSGADFGQNFNPDDVQIEEIGSAVMTLSACHQAELLVDLTGISTSNYTLTKSVEVAGNECANTTKVLPNGISGSWFDPSRNGEGFSLVMFNDNGQSKAHVSWYTYDQGQPMTLTGIAEVSNQTLTVAQLQSFSGADFLTGTSQITNRGTLTMTWDKCRTAAVNYDLTSSGLDSGTMDLVQLSILKDTDCGDLSK
jgi:hypothetical protein